jgi:hypothetical protein
MCASYCGYFLLLQSLLWSLCFLTLLSLESVTNSTFTSEAHVFTIMSLPSVGKQKLRVYLSLCRVGVAPICSCNCFDECTEGIRILCIAFLPEHMFSQEVPVIRFVVIQAQWCLCMFPHGLCCVCVSPSSLVRKCDWVTHSEVRVSFHQVRC